MNPQVLAREVTAQNFLSLPDVVLRLNQLLDSPLATNAAIAELLMTDPALSARVLKLANCALYGLTGRVDTISKGVAVLGLNRIRSLVLTTSVSQAFAGIPEDWVDMDRFWLNSVASGVIARSLAFRCRMFDTELLFLTGLLLKLGRLVFYCSRPKLYFDILKRKHPDELALIAAEREVFGYSHAELGAAVMKLWQLPETLYKIIEQQHLPVSELSYPREAAIIRLASELALVVEPGRSLIEELELEALKLDPDALAYLGLAADVLPNLMLDTWVQTFEIMEIIRPNFAMIH